MSRVKLSRAEIVKAALTLGDAEGLSAISMRRVATELGCEAMSLYGHVANKDDLLGLVAESVLSEFEPQTASSWTAEIIALADEFRRVALEHPNLFPIIVEQMPNSAVALAPVSATLKALRRAGLLDTEVVSAFWALASYVSGALTCETASARGVEQPFPATDALLSPEVASLGPILAGQGWGGEFKTGLQLLLDAIEAKVSP